MHKRISVLGSKVVAVGLYKNLSSFAAYADCAYQAKQAHMRSLRFTFINLYGSYPLVFARFKCFYQSEHVCRLVSKYAGQKI